MSKTLQAMLVVFPVVLLESTIEAAQPREASVRCPSDLLECSPSRAANLPPLLHALWHDARGDWERAHSITQEIDSSDASWLHAYLHRKEGADWNASYWYRRANRTACTGSLHAEWTALATHLLAATPPIQPPTSGPVVGA